MIIGPDKENLTVKDAMQESAKTYTERQKQYGDSYKMVGQIMAILFPGTICPGGVKGHIRMHLVGWIVGKLCRYAASIRSCGTASSDSLKDLAVYAMMLYCEEENANGN